ncbi:MAG: lycopene cyclase domain-containing protein [Candidatus Saccharimonadales bacterium]
MTYLILNILFLATLIFFIPNTFKKPTKQWWILLAAVLLLTAVFDPIIIALHIVAYDPTNILGIYWFGAPIEDFFYALYAVLLIPLAWQKIGASRGK